MTRQWSLLAVLCSALVCSIVLSARGSSQTVTPAVMQAVEAVFPQRLRFAPDADPPLHPYHTCAVVFRATPDGTPDLVAAAYSGEGAEVALLSYKSGVAKIIDAVTDRQFWLVGGGNCETEMVDLANPEQPDSPLARGIKVSFEGPDWFFVWKGKNLENITALESETYMDGDKLLQNSAMHFTDIVDVDHSGAMQIVGQNTDADKFPGDDGISSSGTATLFRYNGTRYVGAKTLLYSEKFGPVSPKFLEDSSGLPDLIQMHKTPESSYQLKIVNGDRDGSNRVTSAQIEINGQMIVLPGEVNQGAETLTRTIGLQKKNEIKVTVEGPASSHVYVTVE